MNEPVNCYFSGKLLRELNLLINPTIAGLQTNSTQRRLFRESLKSQGMHWPVKGILFFLCYEFSTSSEVVQNIFFLCSIKTICWSKTKYIRFFFCLLSSLSHCMAFSRQSNVWNHSVCELFTSERKKLVEEISMDKLRSMNLAWINSGEVTILNNAFPATCNWRTKVNGTLE